MDNNMKADEELISSFKTFPYKTSQYWQIRQDGYRIATVYETEQLLEAIRKNYASASDHQQQLVEAIRKNCASAVEKEIAEEEIEQESEEEREEEIEQEPEDETEKEIAEEEIEEEALRLKDGYLFNFGTLRTFYRDAHEKFRITHKLAVLNTFSGNDTRRIKLYLPLALLHACFDADVDEIKELVRDSVHIKDNISEMKFSTTWKNNEVTVQCEINTKEANLSIDDGEHAQVKNLDCGIGGRGVWDTSRSKVEQTRKKKQDTSDESRSSEEKARLGLALLHCGTPWLNGGTALHFCAWAGKLKAAETLLKLEKDLQTKAHPANKLRLCQDNEGNIALGWAAMSKHVNNCVKICRVLIGKIESRRSATEPVGLDHVNLFGNSWILLAAKARHISNIFNIFKNWRRDGSDFKNYLSGALAHPAKNWSTDQAARTLHPHLFDLLEGNNIMHYLVLRTDAIEKLKEESKVNGRILDLMFYCRNNLGLTAFQAALSGGCSEICEWALSNYKGLSAAEFASRGLAIRDAQGRNILHHYAEGGASKEVGRLIIERLKEAESKPKDQSLPIFERRVKEVGKIKEMIKEMNVEGETPCIVALRRGHSDAFEMLMELWGAEAAMHYLHPRSRDNILHCYAKSANPGVSNWSSVCTGFSMQKLLSARNMSDECRTPIMCALHHGQTKAFRWLLGQEDGTANNLNEQGVLHLFAYYISDDDEAVDALRDLLQKLGGKKTKELINSRWTSYPLIMSQTPLQIAIEKGNVRMCDALLGVDGIDASQLDTGKVLHALSNRNITQDPQMMWEKLLKVPSEDVVKYAHALDVQRRTPLMNALRAGNMKTCKWLLAAGPNYAVVDADDPIRVFESFAAGDCTDKDVWDKLKQAFNLKPDQKGCTPDIASQAIEDSFRRFQPYFRGSNISEDCALMFLRDPDLGAEICYKCLNWISPKSMKSFKVLAHIRRHKHYCQILNHKDILQVAAELECFELFDMALQVQSHQQILQQFEGDRHERLFATIISRNPISSSSCFWQLFSIKITEEKCKPLIMSWTRYTKMCVCPSRLDCEACQMVQDRAKHQKKTKCKQELFSPRALLYWAHAHLAAAGSPASLPQSGDHKLAGAGTSNADIRSQGVDRQGSGNNIALQPIEMYFVDSLAAVFDPSYDQPESLALAKLLGHPDYLLRSIRHNAPKLVALLLLQLSNTTSDCLLLIAELLSSYCSHVSSKEFGDDNIHVKYNCSNNNISAVLNHLLHPKSISFSAFKNFLAPSTAGQNIKTSTQHMRQQRTVLHQIASSSIANVSSKKRSEIHSMESIILLLHYFQFFRIEDTTDSRGATALHLACRRDEHRETAFTLLTICPKLATRITRRSGRTALHDSAFYGCSEIVKDILLFKGENELLDERDADGRTALHFAAESDSENSIEMVKSLLKHANEKEKGEYTALLLWASAGHGIGTADRVAKDPSVAKLLQEKKETGLNLLDLAVKKESDIMIRELINRGADPALPDSLKRIDQLLHGTYVESDQPANKDSLERGPLAKGIAALLLSPFTAVPITIGLFGPWGMGKSSLMLQIEIALMMTIIERNVLPRSAQNIAGEKLPGPVQEELITMKGIELRHKVVTAFRGLTPENSRVQDPPAQTIDQELNQNTSRTCQSATQQNSSTCTRIKLLYKRLQTGFWNCWTIRPESKEDIEKSLEEFLSTYTPRLRPLYKGLALIDRKDLFQRKSSQLKQESVGNFPSCITIHYNAWLYYGEKEASSGLAFTIMKELEECLNTAQWLRLCWRYAYKSDPIFIFSNITLPFIVCIVIGGWVIWIMWKLLSLPPIANNAALTNFRYGSLPVAVVISTWIILRNVVNVVKPVSEQVVKSLQKKSPYEEKLGYHQQIIDDIEFFKEELTEEPGFGWKLLSQIWRIIVENKDNIPFTNIRKSLVQKQNLRIIVFVDDLDRCTKSTYILQLLGAINLILSVCSISVVIGMDKEMVEEVLKSEYNNNTEATQKFLEKIIQLPVYLNEASEREMSTFMQEQLIRKSKSNTFSTTQMHTPIENNSHEGYSKELGSISIIAQNDPSNHIVLNGDNSPKTSKPGLDHQRSEGDSHYEISKGPDYQNEGDTHQHISEGHNKLGIQFQFLMSNYTRTEVATFKYLQSRAKSHQRQPRNCKRLLNYHRLAWYIISQTKSEILKCFNGWQQQLIVWVFICYNWRTEMNEIFKDWKELLKDITPKYANEEITLHQLIELHIQKKKERIQSTEDPETLNNIEKTKEIPQSIEDWEHLRDTLFGTYDIELSVGILFQNYRFHCEVGQLEVEDDVVEDYE